MLSILAPIIGKVIDRIIPDKQAAEKAKQDLAQLEINGELALIAADTQQMTGQMRINQEYAKKDNRFDSGARPFIMWATGITFILPAVFPYISWLFSLAGVHVPVLPIVDTAMQTNLLFALLGVGTMRSWEKFKGLRK